MRLLTFARNCLGRLKWRTYYKIDSAKLEKEDKFALNSGERQVGSTLEDVRLDHRLRYEMAIEHIIKPRATGGCLFGLDLFCGTGYGTSMLSSSLECTLLGVDASIDAIGFANKHYSTPRTLYAAKEFPFVLPRNTFDFIVCFESLEHVLEPHHLLSELIASLKRGGLLFLSTPNEARMPWTKGMHGFHYKHYKFDELVDMVQSAGDLDMVTWFGQNIYAMQDGSCGATLPEAEMILQEAIEGQILLFVFRKA